MNANYGICPGVPVGNGGSSSKGHRLVSLGGGGCSSTNGGGCSSSFAKLKGWPFLFFAVTAPYMYNFPIYCKS